MGLANYRQLFQMERFHWNLRNLAVYAVGLMSQCIIFGFLIAVLLNQKIKGEAIFRTIVIFPFAVSGVVTGVAWRWLMQPTTGINLLIQKLGFENFNFEWNARPQVGNLGDLHSLSLAVYGLCHGPLPGWPARHLGRGARSGPG